MRSTGNVGQQVLYFPVPTWSKSRFGHKAVKKCGWKWNVWLYFFLYMCHVDLKKHTSVAEGETERLDPQFPQINMQVTQFSTRLSDLC